MNVLVRFFKVTAPNKAALSLGIRSSPLSSFELFNFDRVAQVTAVCDRRFGYLSTYRSRIYVVWGGTSEGNAINKRRLICTPPKLIVLFGGHGREWC
ncbi:hypothetical protein L596_012806 [Steinernema carpocapsae]|uniref:Uncharacterized protein n=1 Tax=Steinernema carpocapsae TaxID=34508 RepID=A0A4U5NY73_STECR|nr:hypothetical protein L596_012806 [Steinernema carpocapsae]